MKVLMAAALLMGAAASASAPVFAADEQQSLTVTVYEISRQDKDITTTLRESIDGKDVSYIPQRIGPDMLPSVMGAIKKMDPLSSSSCSAALSTAKRTTCTFQGEGRKLDVFANLLGVTSDGTAIISYGLIFERENARSVINLPGTEIELKHGSANMSVEQHGGVAAIHHIIVAEYR